MDVARARALIFRTSSETHRQLGPAAWIVVTAALIAALVIVAFGGFEWGETTWLTLLAALVAYPVLFAVAFVFNLIRNARHPQVHAEWRVEQTQVWSQPPGFRVAIRHRMGAPFLDGHCCRVRHPNGITYEAASLQPGQGFKLFFDYPSQFQGAAAAIGGQYEISWLLPGSSGKLREVVHHSELISFE